MTNQEAFDGVWNRLVNEFEKGRCYTSMGCVYLREEDGNKCAIGAIMPDELCKEIMSSGLREVSIKRILDPWFIDNKEIGKKVEEHFKGVSVQLLIRLQDIHDMFGDNLSEVKNQMRKIAKDYDLVISQA